MSALSWQLSAVTHACWLGYWALLGETVLVVPPGVGLAAALTVLGLLANARVGRRHPAQVPAERRTRGAGPLLAAG